MDVNLILLFGPYKSHFDVNWAGPVKMKDTRVHCSDCLVIIHLKHKAFIHSQKTSLYFGVVWMAVGGGGLNQ